jgi:c-di-GMP-binding flagellar brake protein YcgR
MVQEETSALRQRRFKRYGVIGSVTLRRKITGPPLIGTAYDLSLGGCLLWTGDQTAIHAADMIEVTLSCRSLSFRSLGHVSYTSEEGRLLGIEFHRLNSQASSDLAAFIADLATD